MMTRITLPALFLLFAISCSDPNNKSTSKDSLAAVAAQEKSSGHELGQDTVKLIDGLVKGIKDQISNNQLKKKAIPGTDGAGGIVYGYYYPDSSLAYIYSSFTAEAGRSERISYYKNKVWIYSEYRFYQFETDAKGVCNSKKEHFRAEKIFYLPESDSNRDSVTAFIDKIDYQCTADALFPKSQLPPTKEMVTRTGIIKDHFIKGGK
jgi:hypothetical protein